MMDEEEDYSVVHPNLDYIIHWRGLRFDHFKPLLFLTPLLYASLFFPYVKDVVSPVFVFALGLALTVGVVVVQWRRPPEYIDFVWQAWTTATELSPFLDNGNETELAVTNLDLWSDEDDEEGE
jgi:hypothetical protein